MVVCSFFSGYAPGIGCESAILSGLRFGVPGFAGRGVCRRRKTVPDSGVARGRTVVSRSRIPRGRSAGHCPAEGGHGLFLLGRLLLGRLLFGCVRGLSLAEFVERRTAPQFEVLSQIDLADHRVGSQLLGRTRLEDFTLEQQVGTVGDGQRFIDVVVGDDDADILVLQRSDDALDVFDSDRIDACERFVEQDEGRVDRYGTGDFGASPLAARQLDAEALAYFLKAELFDQRFAACGLFVLFRSVISRTALMLSSTLKRRKTEASCAKYPTPIWARR